MLNETWTGELRTLGEALAKARQTIREKDLALEHLRCALRSEKDASREIGHRMLNSLQLVASGLRIQERDADSLSTRYALEGVRHRLEAIGRVQRYLDDRGNGRTVDFAQYVTDLASDIGASMGLSCHVDAKSLDIDTEAAADLGIAVNELVINAGKHAGALDGQPIEIRFVPDGVAHMQLTVSDHGPGMPAGFDIGQSKSLGLRIVSAIAERFGGTLYVVGDSGAHFTIRVPVEKLLVRGAA